jgi:hypothetical protein
MYCGWDRALFHDCVRIILFVLVNSSSRLSAQRPLNFHMEREVKI